MVPLQETPPAGWPHTEAAKHQTSLHAGPPPEGRPRPPRLSTQRRPGCCVGTLFLLLVVAVGVAVGIAALVGAFGESDFELATRAFLDAHPSWQVESADYPGEDGAEVRLVAWDYSRDIGRLAIMTPDTLGEEGWSEQPLIESMAGDAAAEDAFLDAFSDTFSATSWTYVSRVEAGDTVSDIQTWRVWYRIWEAEGETWTEERDTWATRDRESAEWVVGSPGAKLPAEESTTTP